VGRIERPTFFFIPTQENQLIDIQSPRFKEIHFFSQTLAPSLVSKQSTVNFDHKF
jgi:hypothetical protein